MVNLIFHQHPWRCLEGLECLAKNPAVKEFFGTLQIRAHLPASEWWFSDGNLDFNYATQLIGKLTPATQVQIDQYELRMHSAILFKYIWITVLWLIQQCFSLIWISPKHTERTKPHKHNYHEPEGYTYTPTLTNRKADLRNLLRVQAMK